MCDIKTRLLCYSAMNNYTGKSLEELRIEDYMANRKVRMHLMQAVYVAYMHVKNGYLANQKFKIAGIYSTGRIKRFR